MSLPCPGVWLKPCAGRHAALQEPGSGQGWVFSVMYQGLGLGVLGHAGADLQLQNAPCCWSWTGCNTRHCSQVCQHGLTRENRWSWWAPRPLRGLMEAAALHASSICHALSAGHARSGLTGTVAFSLVTCLW